MSTPTKDNEPAQVPGDAESPPKGEEDRKMEERAKHIGQEQSPQTGARKN